MLDKALQTFMYLWIAGVVLLNAIRDRGAEYMGGVGRPVDDLQPVQSDNAYRERGVAAAGILFVHLATPQAAGMMHTTISGKPGDPDQKLTVTLPFEGGAIALEIPASGALSPQDEFQDRKWALIWRATDAIRSALPPRSEPA